MKIGDNEQHYQKQYEELLKEKRMNPILTISPEGEIREVMTLRDHFAGLAMQGLIADHVLEAIPRLAFEMADAMLKQRGLK